MKQLFRVAIEGEVWVMAKDKADAEREAAYYSSSDDIDYYVYPMLPVSPSLVETEVLESLPYNADPGDERTVGDHLRELAAARSQKPAAVSTTKEE